MNALILQTSFLLDSARLATACGCNAQESIVFNLIFRAAILVLILAVHIRVYVELSFGSNESKSRELAMQLPGEMYGSGGSTSRHSMYIKSLVELHAL